MKLANECSKKAMMKLYSVEREARAWKHTVQTGSRRACLSMLITVAHCLFLTKHLFIPTTFLMW